MSGRLLTWTNKDGPQSGTLADYIRMQYPAYGWMGLLTWEAVYAHLVALKEVAASREAAMKR